MSILKKVLAGTGAAAVAIGLSAVLGAGGAGVIHSLFGDSFMVTFYALAGLGGVAAIQRAVFSPETFQVKSERVGFGIGGLLAATLAFGGMHSELKKKDVVTPFRAAVQTTVPVASNAVKSDFKLSK